VKTVIPRHIATMLDEMVERLATHLDIRKIILFGSYTTGQFTRDSDLDLMIIMNTREKGLKRYASVSRLLEPRKMPLDIIVKTPREVRQRKAFFDPFFKSIMQHGKVLYEKKT
jgi:predicted nucleotidyltransferase